ncbi:PIG-L family deacetylase [Microbacterium trichothecenolyticum]|uniref:LmbE family N-acetylglucosaminyl deacetylase n=1 Tax=Microbacterium trichothecenolyticum TaxID=69370 RepID=A0ABU0TU96_MICTR|nr:PIG-L family deacetylase [Microbacterium trichothecenolyticum]MDQ1123230.1 LmbE family N-acetylglucosaminyl deacetylase [Microbacterium trichothecenolyticum]
MSDDEASAHEGAPDADAARARARRRTITRRAAIAGGLTVLGLGGGALLYRQLRRSAGPEGAYVPLAPIVPGALASPRPLSPAAEPPGRETTLAVWAHADDDIIFANPALAGALRQGSTIRAVYVTAGDGGRGLEYAEQREAGLRAAYDRMRDSAGPWETHTIDLLSGARVTRFVPSDDARLSITMLRLPDGNLDATGFAATGNAGLTQLINGATPRLSPIDGAPAYDLSMLLETIAELADASGAQKVATNIPHASAYARGDHPDHSCVGSLVRAVVPKVGIPVDAVSYFVGYPSQHEPVNIEGATLDAKVGIYETYAAHDPVVTCADASACLAQPGFGQWLRRSYPKKDDELRME